MLNIQYAINQDYNFLASLYVLSFSVPITSFRQFLKHLLEIEIFFLERAGEQCIIILRGNNGKSPHTHREENINDPIQSITLLRHKGHEVRILRVLVKLQNCGSSLAKLLPSREGPHQRHMYYDDSIKPSAKDDKGVKSLLQLLTDT
jgi:hypothetical protein